MAPATANPSIRTEAGCPLCGARFDPHAEGCSPSCPMSKGCSVTCCPACGYSFPREDAGLAGRLRRALDRFERRRTGT